MKKVFTLIAAIAMLATSSFAQAGNKEVSPLKASNGLVTRVAKHNAKVTGNPYWEDTMSYCLNAPFSSAVGVGSTTADVYWAIKIESAALAGRSNITDVEFYVYTEGTYDLSLVQGSASGTPLYTQTVTAAITDTMAWKTVHFTTPVAISQTQDLWVVMHNIGVQYPAAGVVGNSYDNGKYISLDGATFNLVTDYSLDYTWMIRVVSDTYTPQPPSIAVDGPATVLMGQAATFTANTTVSTIGWYVDGTVQSSTGSTLTYTFTTDGLHEVVAEATNTVGTSYDTLTVNVVDCSQPVTLPYTEGFESDIPCWTMVSADPANDNRFGVFTGTTAYAGQGYFQFSSYSTAPNGYEQYLISPELNLTSGNDAAVSFWYKCYNAGDIFDVLVSTTTADTSAFTTVLGTALYAADWTFAAYQLPAATKYVALKYYGDYAYYTYIDNFTFAELAEPVVTLDGPDTIGTGITAIYTANVNMADTAIWYVDGNDMNVTGDTLVHVFTTAGTHTVVIEATNAIGSASDTIVVDVYSCDGITLPYNPTFGADLGCWFSESRLEESGWFTAQSASLTEGQVYSVSAQNSIFGMFSIDHDNWLYSPFIEMPATGSYEVSWSVKPYNANYAGDHYGVYVITGTDTTIVFEETLNSNMTGFEARTAAIPAVTGDFRIAFRHWESEGGYVILLDQIAVRSLTAPVVTLLGPAEAETNTEVTFTAVSGTATSYAWTVDGNAVSATGSTLTHTFTAEGNHTVSVTASNSIGTASDALTVEAYACNPNSTPYDEGFENGLRCWTVDDLFAVYSGADYAEYAHSGNAFLLCGYDDYDDVDQWAVSPAVTLPAEGEDLGLAWYVHMREYQGIQNTYEIRVSTTGTEPADFTNLLFTETGATSDYVYRSRSLAAFAGQTIRFAIHNISDMGGNSIFFDDFHIATGVGIENAEQVNVAVWPNPAADMLNVSGEGVRSVELIDVNGRTVLTNMGAGSIDISSLASGVYIVRTTAENGVNTQKIVKK